MTDIYSKKKRSWIMSRIRSSGSRMEFETENLLREARLAYEAQPRDVFGKPDFAIRSQKVAIFCDSDFWHGRGIGPEKLVNMTPFWRNKILDNKRRDRLVNGKLKAEGWR